MWTKILVLLVGTAISSHAVKNGYTYDKPAIPVDFKHFKPIVQSPMAYYVNIPATQDTRQTHSDYTGFPERAEPNFGLHSDYSRCNNEIPLDHRQLIQNVKFNQHLNHISPRSYERATYFIFQKLPFEDPRNSNSFRVMTYQHPNSLPHQNARFHTINQDFHHQQNRNILSPQMLLPKSIRDLSQKPYRVMPPTSYNIQLPFQFGTVPINFKPLPLKTHLPQSKLLPITSYEAGESYKK